MRSSSKGIVCATDCNERISLHLIKQQIRNWASRTQPVFRRRGVVQHPDRRNKRSGDFASRLFVSRTRESFARSFSCCARTWSNAKCTTYDRSGALNHRINIAKTFPLLLLLLPERLHARYDAVSRDWQMHFRGITPHGVDRFRSPLFSSPCLSSPLATCRQHAYRRKEKYLADVAGDIQIRVISGYRLGAFHRPVFKFLTTCRRDLLLYIACNLVIFLDREMCKFLVQSSDTHLVAIYMK